MGVRAHISKSGAQKYEQNRESLWENTRAKLLNQLLAISWKLYAGKFLETIYYSFKAVAPGARLSIPAAQTFLERSEVK